MCCFAGDTQIKLANGETKAIKDIRVGDQIRGAKKLNHVKKIHTPFLHFRKKYSINDGEYFTTAEHPFQTTEGWKAIKPKKKWWDPETWSNWFHNHKDLDNIGQLKVGDKIITELGQIEIKKIKSSWNPLNWFEKVYNLTLDNDNTYYANNYLVHNKGGNGGGIISRVFDFIGDIVEGVVKIFTSPFGLDLTVPEVSASQTEQIQGVLLNKDSGITNVPIIYGTRMVGGARVFVSTNGSGNEYLYVAYVLGEGQVDSYTQLLIDDIVVTPNSFAHGTRTGTSTSPYSDESRLELQFFDGRDDQVASTLLKEAPGWTDDHRLRGLCYLAAKFRWKKIEDQEDADNNPYGGGIPNVKVTVKGKKIFDLTAAYTPQNVGSFTGQTGSASGLLNRRTETATMVHSVSSQTSSNTIQDQGVTFTLNQEANVKVIQNMSTQINGTPTGFAENSINFTIEKTSDGSTVFTDSKSKSIGRFSFVMPTGASNYKSDLAIQETVTLPAGNYRFNAVNTVTHRGAVNRNTQYYLSVQIEDAPVQENHTTAYASETVAFNNNPVNVLLDYMRNPRYGKGLPNDAFHWNSWRKMAKLCDQVVSYTSSTTGKAFTCDAVVETSTSIMNNCKILLVGFRGIMPYTQGQYRLKIENAGDDDNIESIPSDPPVSFTANEDNIVGGLSLIGDNKETKVNRARVTYVDPNADYQPNEVIYPEDGSSDDTQFLSEDNNQRFEATLSLPTVAHREQALQYAEVFVKRSRNAKQIQFATNIAGSNVAVGDLCRVTSPNIGLDGQFRITDIRLNAEGDIQITGFEHQPTIYTINAKAADITRPSLNLPNPLTVPPVTGVTVTSGSSNQASSGYVAESRLNVTWTATTDPFFKEYIVQFKLAGDSTYITAGITNDTQFFIAPVTSGEQYDVRVASRNELNRRSNYANATRHTVS